MDAVARRHNCCHVAQLKTQEEKLWADNNGGRYSSFRTSLMLKTWLYGAKLNVCLGAVHGAQTKAELHACGQRHNNSEQHALILLCQSSHRHQHHQRTILCIPLRSPLRRSRKKTFLRLRHPGPMILSGQLSLMVVLLLKNSEESPAESMLHGHPI